MRSNETKRHISFFNRFTKKFASKLIIDWQIGENKIEEK
jgi:hypothetical protein